MATTQTPETITFDTAHPGEGIHTQLHGHLSFSQDTGGQVIQVTAQVWATYKGFVEGTREGAIIEMTAGDAEQLRQWLNAWHDAAQAPAPQPEPQQLAMF